METNEKPEQQHGGIYNYFQGATIHNLVINGNMTRSGTENYYQEKQQQESGTAEQNSEGIRQSVMDYVARLMPVVATEFREQFAKIWHDILEQEAVSRVVYDKGSQKGTVFNRNLVAQISHMMVIGGVIVKKTTDVRMAELLEPEKGKNHPVRGALALSPEDKQVKKAVSEVLERYGVKVL